MYKDLQEYMRTKISVPLPSKRCRSSTGEMAGAHNLGSCFRIMHVCITEGREENEGCLLFGEVGHSLLRSFDINYLRFVNIF